MRIEGGNLNLQWWSTVKLISDFFYLEIKSLSERFDYKVRIIN